MAGSAKPPPATTSGPKGIREARLSFAGVVALPALRLCHDAQPDTQGAKAISLLHLLCGAEAWLAGLSVEGGSGRSDRTVRFGADSPTRPPAGGRRPHRGLGEVIVCRAGPDGDALDRAD